MATAACIMCSVENGCAVTPAAMATSVRGLASSQSDLAQPSRPVNELLLLGLLRRLPLLLPPWVPFVCCRSKTAPLLPDLLAMLQAAAEQRAATGEAAEAWWSQCTDPATPRQSAQHPADIVSSSAQRARKHGRGSPVL